MDSTGSAPTGAVLPIAACPCAVSSGRLDQRRSECAPGFQTGRIGSAGAIGAYPFGGQLMHKRLVGIAASAVVIVAACGGATPSTPAGSAGAWAPRPRRPRYLRSPAAPSTYSALPTRRLTAPMAAPSSSATGRKPTSSIRSMTGQVTEANVPLGHERLTYSYSPTTTSTPRSKRRRSRPPITVAWWSRAPTATR